MLREKLYNFVETCGTVVYLKKGTENNLDIFTLFNKDKELQIEIIKGVSIKSLEESLSKVMKSSYSSILNMFCLSDIEIDEVMNATVEDTLGKLDTVLVNHENKDFDNIINTLNFKTFESSDFGKYNYTIIEFALSVKEELAFFTLSNF